MNTGLSNLVLGDFSLYPGTTAAPSNLAGTNSSERFSPALFDDSSAAYAQEATTADNNFANALNNPINSQPQEFYDMSRKQAATETAPKTQAEDEVEEQNGYRHAVAVQPGTVQDWLAKYAQTAEYGKQAVATKKMVFGPKAGYELSQTLTGLKASGLPTDAGEVAKTVVNESVPAIASGGQSESKGGSAQISKELLSADNSQLEEGENGDKTSVSSNIITSQKETANQVTPRESANKTLADGDKATSGGEKSAGTAKPVGGEKISSPSGKELAQDGPNASEKSAGTAKPVGGEKISSSSGKELAQDGANASEKAADTAKPVGGEKTSSSSGKDLVQDGANASEKAAVSYKPAISTPTNTDLQTIQNKSSDLQSQADGIDLGKTAVAEKPVYSKDSSDGQGDSGVSELAKFLQGGNKELQPNGNNSLGESIFKNLSQAQVQVFANQKQHPSDMSSNNDNSDKGFKQLFSAGNVQSPATEQTSVSAPVGKSSSVFGGETSTSIREQIQESIHVLLNQGSQQVTVRLNPPELGRVFIKFQEQDGQIVGSLEVSKPQTRAEIDQALPEIIRNLSDHGIQIKRLDVMLTNQQEQQSFKDQSLMEGQSNWSGRQDPANPGSSRNDSDWTGGDGWSTNAQSYTGFIEPHIQITNDSINMLA